VAVKRGFSGLVCLWLFRAALVLPPVAVLIAFAGVSLTSDGPHHTQSGQVAIVELAVPLAGFWLLSVPLSGLLAWLTRARHHPPA
jgi:hypothetical protein